jgi:hypothetical protein
MSPPREDPPTFLWQCFLFVFGRFLLWFIGTGAAILFGWV